MRRHLAHGLSITASHAIYDSSHDFALFCAGHTHAQPQTSFFMTGNQLWLRLCAIILFTLSQKKEGMGFGSFAVASTTIHCWCQINQCGVTRVQWHPIDHRLLVLVFNAFAFFCACALTLHDIRMIPRHIINWTNWLQHPFPNVLLVAALCLHHCSGHIRFILSLVHPWIVCYSSDYTSSNKFHPWRTQGKCLYVTSVGCPSCVGGWCTSVLSRFMQVHFSFRCELQSSLRQVSLLCRSI